jgi:opacity protein-like surface antigen
MRTFIIVPLALGLISTTSSAMAQESPAPLATAKAESPRRHHRLLLGSSLGGGGYGGQGSPLLGFDVSYAYRIASGADFGVTTTLATGQIFAGGFADVVVVPLSRNVSWRLGADAGVHRVSNRYRGAGGLLTDPEHYDIVSAPYGVFLPYAGARMSFDRTGASGRAWGFQLQVRQDLMKQRHMVVVDDAWGEEHHVGGRTITLGFYLGAGL